MRLILKSLLGVILQMSLLLAQGKDLVVRNWPDEIQNAPVDAAVNIQIAPLAGDNQMTMYATVLKPGSQVKAHVHHKGTELYHILSGTGEMYTGHFNQVSGQVAWRQPSMVKTGDVFAIDAGITHQLRNTSSSEDLVLIFVCPPEHLQEDRTITTDYEAA